MNITLFGVVFNGYGKYVDNWVESILKQEKKPKEIIIVLGKNHNTPTKTINKIKKHKITIIYVKKELTMGALYNVAIKKATSEWQLRVDIDDILLPNAIKEIEIKSKTCDAVSLKFLLNGTEKSSPIPKKEELKDWRKKYNESGYVAIKRKYKGKILYYDDNNFPNFPFLFKAVYIGMSFGITDNACAVYEKKTPTNPLLKSAEALEEACKILDDSAVKYSKTQIILTIIIPVYNNENLISKCLDSIELRDDIELIIIDDFSTDNSVEKVNQWINKQSFKNILFIKNEKNLGVGSTVNKGYDLMKGDYVLTLCDDDYLLEPITKLIDELDGTDLVYFNLKSNSGKIWDGTELPGSSKVYKKTIIGSTRRINQNYGGDKVFYKKILEKNPTKKDTKLLLYYYNYPRENSLMDKAKKKNDITVYTIAYNGYGNFLNNWIKHVKNQNIKADKIVIVLGNKHGAEIKQLNELLKGTEYKIIKSKSDIMGILRNEAIKEIDTTWMLYFSADDILLPNAISEIKNKAQISDAVVLRYREKKESGIEISKQSALITMDTILQWKTTGIPGYIAIKREYKGNVLYYEEIEIPNYPYLFMIAYLGLKQTATAEECAIYLRRTASHGDIAKKTHKVNDYFSYINNRAVYYYNLKLDSELQTAKIIKRKIMIFKTKQRFQNKETLHKYRANRIIELPYNEERKIYLESNNLAEYIESREEVVYNVSGKSN